MRTAPKLKQEALLELIEAQERHVEKLTARFDEVRSSLRKHRMALRKLRSMTGAAMTYTRYQRPNVEGDTEWYSLGTAVKYGVQLSGSGWYLAVGKHQRRAVSTTFHFKVPVDSVAKALLEAYAKPLLDKVVCTRCSVTCTDVGTALELSRLLNSPTKLRWVGVYGPTAKTKKHTRLSTVTDLNSVRIVREVSTQHGTGRGQGTDVEGHV